MFQNTGQFVDASLAGKTRVYTFRKSPTQTTVTRLWFDMSMSPGNPVPQYYAASPLVAVQMKQSTDGGLFHGADVSPSAKFLYRVCKLSTVATALPMPMILCDYLLYYPFIDDGTTDAQTLTNSVSLPRYTDGVGVQCMAVSVASRTGGQTFRITYTNSDGTAGRVSQTVQQNTSTVIGNIVTSDGAVANAAGPFIPLQAGDSGIRSIQSVQMISGADVGLFTLVLVKPLLTTQIVGIDAPVEVECLKDRGLNPRIYDDAYLNFLCLPQGSLAATSIHGYIETIYS